MWYEPKFIKTDTKNVNKELRELKGELTDKQARITLMKFLRRNIGFTTELLTGIKLYPDQIITIKGMMARDNTLCVWGRGVSKTWTSAVYCILQCIFEPGCKILIAGPTFRTARFIFNHIESIAESKQAALLFQAVGKPIHRNDEYRYRIGTSEIAAIPLNGEKIRGFRATVLLIDEFLLMSEEIVERVLIPFLAAGENQKLVQQIRERETRLIKLGKLKEEQRRVFDNKKKFIALSSASYQCEYLYRKFNQYVAAITSETPSKGGETYFVSQLAWNSVPADRMDKKIISLAQSNEAASANFRREYGAEFLDGSDSFFSMNKMLACSVPDGENETLLLQGDPNKRYILAIDPNFSNSASADFFAMCVIELDEDNQGGTVVHSYAEAGKDLKDHINYLFYLWTHFNIVLIAIDYAGYQFIDAANESTIFKENKINLKIFEFESTKDGAEYQEELKKAQKQYNRQMNKIVFTQYFGTGDFIRKANEHLQGCIDYKHIWFGAGIKACPAAFDRAIATSIDESLFDKSDLPPNETFMTYFIDRQDTLIKQTRYQCASIEVKISIKGVQTFDLPQVMRRDTSSGRMRRDNYTALMLATWAMKSYADIMSKPKDNSAASFTPFMV